MKKGPQPFKPAAIADDPSADDAWNQLMQLRQKLREQKRNAIERKRDDTGIKLGSWYYAGPFKNKPFGIVAKAFATIYPPEQEALAAGREPIDLTKTWETPRLLDTLETIRRWEKQPQWTDGYRHQLPIGPAPGRNETCYLYRTIKTESESSLDVDIRAEDLVRVWLNGKLVGEASNKSTSASRFPAVVRKRLNLEPGENRLLVKISTMFGAHGFAFSAQPLTPGNDLLPGRLSVGSKRVAAGAKPQAAEILRLLELPGSAVRLLPRSPEELKKLHARAVAHATAMWTVRDFRFDVRPVPMFDPPWLKMVATLEATGPTSPGGNAYLRRLAGLRRQVEAANTEEETTRAAKAVDRMWADVLAELPPIAFVKRSFFSINAIAPYDSHGRGPASICILDPGNPDQPPKVIYHDPTGTIFDMNLSLDGKTIFFAARRGKAHWHICEVGTDGQGFKQITDGPHQNISPVELPSGELMFVSTRMGTYTMCQPRRSGLLYVANRDGTNVRRVSSNTLSDHTPQVMDDGRILFTRWDYGIDKNVFARQTLWTVNPDGTQLRLFFGNTIEDPNAFWEASPIPGRPEVLCVFGPHHTHHAGMLGLVWNRLGIEAPRGEGFRWVTTEMPSIGDTTFSRGYQDPFPINERLFLASYGGQSKQNQLYLVDDRGNKKLIYGDDRLGCWDPVLVKARKRPPVLSPASENPEFVFRDPVEANRCPETGNGTYLLQDVYEGLSPIIKRGEIKEIQILEQMPKTRTQAGGYSVWGYQVTMSRGTMFARRLIGTVPVEEDGSAYFTAPAGRDISFNALDAAGRTLKRMGSTTQLMPGEVQGCIGCHEHRDSAPAIRKRVPLASKRPPSQPKRPKWGTGGVIDFVQVIQPILDRHCVKCHGGPTPDGLVDLSGDKTQYFNMAYNQLVDRGLVQYLGPAAVGHGETTTKALGAMVSPLRKYIEEDHYKVKLSDEERRTIYAWIDANIPYYGTYVHTDGRIMGARDRWYVHSKDKWFAKDFMPVFNRRCMQCHQRRVADTHNYNFNPGGPITVTSNTWTEESLNQFQFGHGRINMIAQIGPAHRINLTHPEWSLMLTAPLTKKDGGLGLCHPKDGMPKPFSGKDDPDYQAMLRALQKAHKTLLAHPRVDMLGEAASTTRQGTP